MKPLLFVLLAASLVANVALIFSARRSAPAVADATPSVPAGGNSASTATAGQVSTTAAASRPGGSSAPAAAAPPAWSTARTDQDLHRVVAGLRAAGYPAAIIRAVVNQLLNERFTARSPNSGQPFWKRATPSAEGAAAQTALNNERQALFETLLGPDARPSALLDADARERRYGTLADDKIDAIAKIERDYNEMSSEAYAKRRGNAVANGEVMMQTQQLMEKEKLADLAATLSPEEFAQYEMRNSNSARTLINNLRNVDVTAAEYARLYEAQKAFDVANPQRATMDSSVYAQRQLAQLALNDQARTVLGDNRFYSYLEGVDRTYATMAQVLAKYPAVTPATTYQVYQLQTELQTQMTSQTSRTGPPSPEKIEDMRNMAAAYNAKLETLLGPEAAGAYRQQGLGRIFTPFRQGARPATPATLVPLGK